MVKPIKKKRNSLKPVARMVSRFSAVLEKAFAGDHRGEGWMLPISLDAAVPLWAMKFQYYTNGERDEELKSAMTDDLCLRLEYVLHRGPKKGDSARSFNDLARSIALLSFCPGGIRLFGRHWEWKRERIPVDA